MHGNMGNTLGFLVNYKKISKETYLSGVSFTSLVPTVLFARPLPLGDFNLGVVVFCFFVTEQHGSVEEMITATARPWFL